MSLLALVPGSRVITDGGRRYVCRPPTVRTWLLARALFSAECDRIEQARAEGVEWTTSAEDDVLLLCLGDARATAVLATCCALVGGEPGDFEERVGDALGLQRSLAEAVLSLCDGAQVARELSTAQPTTGDPSAAAIGHGVDELLASVAARHGVPPHEVLDWPVESFIAARGHVQPTSDAGEPLAALAGWGVAVT